MAIKVKKLNMNEFNNIVSNINPKEPIITNKEDTSEVLTFSFEEFYDTKKLKTFIKNVEKKVRTSKEYTTYIGILKNEHGLSSCAINGNIENDDTVSIEFHHYPFTLYDIVNIVIMDKIVKDEKFNSFSIIKEVINLHSENKVGLVPLTITNHQLVHEGVKFVPLYSVFGRVNDFINDYYDCMDDSLMEKYNDLLKMDSDIRDKRDKL